MQESERQLQFAANPGAPPGARIGAVTFLQRFGSALNAHIHFHCCITDGLFSRQADALSFRPASAPGEADIAAVQTAVRTRALRWFARHRLLSAESAADMQR